jgi:ribonucleoside-diphosphate reductase alpha chain
MNKADRKPVQTSEGPTLNALAQEVLHRRYLRKDPSGKVIETPDMMLRRVAQAVAQGNSSGRDSNRRRWMRAYYRLMRHGLFLPNSPTLMNAGRLGGLLSACFTLPIEDSIDGIFSTVKHTALIQKSGGGTGFSLDRLRPTGDLVRSSGGRTSGPLSFLRVLSETTNAIQQGAFRRGANMAMMSIDHPDILRFLQAKTTPSAFTNFNFSVKIPEAFMQRLKDTPDVPHVVANPRTGRRYVIPRSVNANSYTIDDLLPENEASSNECYTVQDIWNTIVESAWATGEPGVCFIDRINQHNPTPQLDQIEACNPCGEQPLLPYEACNLGSIDVSKFIVADGTDFDWGPLGGDGETCGPIPR